MTQPGSRRFSHHKEEVIVAPPGSPTPWSVAQNIQVYTPTPPSDSLGRDGRKTASRRRTSVASSSDSQNQDITGHDPFARRPSRPSSSLSKYKPLPDIGSKSQEDNLSFGVDQLDLSLTQADGKISKIHSRSINQDGDHKNPNKIYNKSRDKEVVTSSPKKHSTAKRKQDRQSVDTKSNKPSSTESTKKKQFVDSTKTVTLAIKLPETGDRISETFRVSDTLQTVMKFVQEKSGNKKLSRLYYLAINVPRKIYSDPKMTIQEAQLQDKTVLYLIEKKLE